MRAVETPAVTVMRYLEIASTDPRPLRGSCEGYEPEARQIRARAMREC